MNKKSILAAVLSISGLLLAAISGFIWYAYETGFSYVLSYYEELAIINRARICFLIGCVLFGVGMAIIAKLRSSK